MPVACQNKGNVTFTPRVMAAHDMCDDYGVNLGPVTHSIDADTRLTISFDDGFLRFRFRDQEDAHKGMRSPFYGFPIEEQWWPAYNKVDSIHSGCLIHQFSGRPAMVAFLRGSQSDLVTITRGLTQGYAFKPGRLVAIDENIYGETTTYTVPGQHPGDRRLDGLEWDCITSEERELYVWEEPPGEKIVQLSGFK